MQYACAMKSMVDVIVTRDVSGFLGSEIPLLLKLKVIYNVILV